MRPYFERLRRPPAKCEQVSRISSGGVAMVYPVNSDDLAAHLLIDRYGDFLLTDAIRPSPAFGVIPRQGYRRDLYRDDDAGLKIPVLAAAVSRERLFDLFLELLEPLGPTVDVVLETSHGSASGEHKD